jgi:hypothetical protein
LSTEPRDQDHDVTTRQQRRPAQPVPRYALTRQEAAASLGMSVDTFERRVQPFIMVVPCGQLILVPPAEIERWIKANARYLVDQVA